MINVVAMRNRKLSLNLPLEDIFSDDIHWYWVDFNQPTKEEIKELEHTFHFHPLAIEDCIHKLQRPKLDYYEENAFFVTHSLYDLHVQKEETNFFIGKNYIVSFHYHESKEINEVFERLTHSKMPDSWNAYLIFYHILDKIVDNYFPVIYELEDRLNHLENHSPDVSMESLLDKLFDIRHALLNFRHTVIPMRDLLYRILNSHRLDHLLEHREYFSDIHDHLLRLTEKIDASREITTDIRDSYLSLNSHQTNRVMRVLTVITTIFMPLTFIAGIYGMNFDYMPELAWKLGYHFILFIMLFIGLGMFLWFKNKGWFR